jgi:hypothetical protein
VVWERDGGQCTFVSEGGRRCEARKALQFDHVLVVARGGEATVDGIRLRCRAHNQFTAERTFGAGFMRHKRISAAELRAAAQAARAKQATRTPKPDEDPDRSVGGTRVESAGERSAGTPAVSPANAVSC